MPAPRLTDAGVRLSEMLSDAAPSPQRSALALFGFVAPCAIGLAVAVGDATRRPIVLVFAIALAALQIVYLSFGSPGARGWAVLSVAVPATVAVTTLTMHEDLSALLPLLFTSVCWTALSLRGPLVAANVVATIVASGVPLIARSLGWDAGTAAGGLGLLLVSAAGFALVGTVVYRLAAALRLSNARAQAARIESERARQVSDAVVGALQDGLVLFAPNGRIVQVNDKLCELTGFRADELIGALPPLPYMPLESHDLIQQHSDHVDRHGRGEFDVVLRRKNGERFPAIVTAGVTRGDGSRVVMIKDVAERAKLVAETHEAREAFARSAGVIGEYLYTGELMPDERFVVGARGPGLAALVGAAEEAQVLLETYDDFVHPDDRAAYDLAWRFSDLQLLDGDIVQQEYRLVGMDGETRWVRDRAAVTARGGRVLLTGAACDISQQRRAEEERSEAVRRLEWLSSVDTLTELFNRRHFSEVLRARLAGSGAGAAIALVDVDHFKRINDSHGHLIGDVVLREIARRLKDATRPGDVTSRWGGEEFCILLDEISDEAELQALAERLRAFGLGDADRARRRHLRGRDDLDRRRAALAGMRHPRAAARERRRGALRRQARRPQSGAHRPRCTGARAGAVGRRTRGGRAGAGRGGVRARRRGPDALRAGGGAVDRRRRAARALRRRRGARAPGRLAARLRQGRRARRHPLAHAGRSTSTPARASATTPIAGEALVSVVPGLGAAAQVVRSHHERFDGAGYPDGLAGEDIPIVARIVAAADAFVAMTEHRPYEGPRGRRDALAELERSSGSQFDPEVVTALVAVLEHERRGDEARAS